MSKKENTFISKCPQGKGKINENVKKSTLILIYSSLMLTIPYNMWAKKKFVPTEKMQSHCTPKTRLPIMR